MKIILKKGATIHINTTHCTNLYIADKDANFNISDTRLITYVGLTSGQPVSRRYVYMEVYPVFNNEEVLSIEWDVNDANELVL